MSHKGRWIEAIILIGVVVGLCFHSSAGAIGAETAVVVPAPGTDNPKVAGALQSAVLAGGCFWGVQAVYQHVPGVRSVLAGYSGGSKATAEYETVSTGATGHAESVQITFDPKELSFGEILQIYFSVVHDPTQLDRQGPDTGSQYRSNIFYADDAQKKIATAYIVQLEKANVFKGKIVTRVDSLKAFYPAEDYHQDFLIKNPKHLYIVKYDIPKIQNLKSALPAFYRGEPVMVKKSN